MRAPTDPNEPSDPLSLALRLGASLLLLGAAGIEAAWGLAVGPLGALFAGNVPHLVPPLAWARGGAAAMALVALSLGVSGFTALSAVLLAVHPRRGWWFALAAAVLWLPTGCVPASALVLVVLLLPGVRPAPTPAAPAPPADPAAG